MVIITAMVLAVATAVGVAIAAPVNSSQWSEYVPTCQLNEQGAAFCDKHVRCGMLGVF